MSKSLLSSTLLLAFWLCSITAWAQRTVTGRITSSEDGSGLPGVNVVLKGTTVGTSTNIDGNYSLAVPDDPNTVIVFSSIGFKTQERAIGTSSGIDIILEIDVAKLDEAVVIGYGTTTRRDVTGSLATVSSKDFQQGVITTPEQLIAGKAAGVQITQNSGAPGSGSTIRIRGSASVNATNDPLIVVDGVPLDNGNIAGSPNPLSMINPNDIETFTVLKDASAAAIYGSRASNGVILITTKRGADQARPMITFSSQNSVSMPRKLNNVLDAAAFRKLILDPKTKASAVQKSYLSSDTTINTNWQKQIYQLAKTTDNNLSVSGTYRGTGFKLPYRASFGYLDQQGLLRTEQMQRQSVQLALSPTVMDGHLKINMNLKGSRQENRFADGGAIGNASSYDPTKPVYSNATLGNPSRFNGFYEILNADGSPSGLTPRNPVALLLNRENRGVALRTVSNIQLDYSFHGLPELRANVNLGIDWSYGHGTDKVNDSAAQSYLPKTRALSGFDNQYRQFKNNQLIEAYLAYNKDFGKHHVDALAGYSFQDFMTYNPAYRGHTYSGDTLPGSTPPQFAYDRPRYALLSYYGRFNYNYDERYLFTASLREDQSSRFAKDKRAGYFPSLALAWNAARESFLKDQKILTTGKIRLGYGETGQQDIGGNLYGYQGVYITGSNQTRYQLGNNFYNTSQPVAYDPQLRWETTTTYNAGVDLGFLKDRIMLSADVFLKKTKDLLAIVNTAAGTNYSDQLLRNFGSSENRGLELALNTVPVLTDKIRWDLGVNATFVHNKITQLTNDTASIGVLTGGISGGTGTQVQINATGSPINSFYLFEQVYDSVGHPIETKFKDINGDGKITDKDRVIHRQPNPTFYYGINSNFSYKNFTLSFVCRGGMGGYIYNNTQSNTGRISAAFPSGPGLSNVNGSVLQTGFTGKATGAGNFLLSDYWLQSANFFRMDNLSVSYNAGSLISPKIGLIISGTVQNLFVITPYKGTDPEIPGGIDNSFYARPRVYIVGLNFILK